jgi:hypothetical protein
MMMSLGITDVVILPNDTTATFFRITNVSQTITFAQNCERITTSNLIHLYHWNTYTDGNLTKNHTRISTVAQQVYTTRTERAIPRRNNQVN